MELRQLQYFIVLVEELHFGRAAERLNIVQPAVTQQIQRLERVLGVVLFDRSRRQIQLTPAGERLVPRARAVLDAVDQAVAAARGELNGPQTLELGTTEGMGWRLDAVLGEIVSRRGDLAVQLHEVPVEQRLAAVRSGRIQATFVRALTAADGLRIIPLWRDPLLAVVPRRHPVAGLPSVRLTDLQDLPLRMVDRQRNPAFVDLVLDACRAASFMPIRGPEFSSVQNTLAEIAVAEPSWTVLHDGLAVHRSGVERAAVLPIHPPVMVLTSLAVREPPGELAGMVLDACLKVFAGDDVTDLPPAGGDGPADEGPAPA